MIGAIAGDIVGSKYEFDNIKTKDFELFSEGCEFTDDTVMTVAVADALIESREKGRNFTEAVIEKMKQWCMKYPYAGYGYMFFHNWVVEDEPKPYNSFGNGSAMRVSACGFAARTLDEALLLAKRSAEVSHNHPEGIKGAQATAGAIFLAKSGKTKEEIKRFIGDGFYKLEKTVDEIRPDYAFNETCQETVPQAIQAFLESENFEDAIRTAISLGGDSDTLACITGGIAEAFYGIPKEIEEKTLSYLDDDLKAVVIIFKELYM